MTYETDDLLTEGRRNQRERLVVKMYPNACDVCARQAVDDYEDDVRPDGFAAWALSEAPWLPLAAKLPCGCCDHGDYDKAVSASPASVSGSAEVAYWNVECNECKTIVDVESEG